MTTTRKINVLIVDDSLVVRALLARTLAEDPEIHIAGEARDGAEALAALEQITPDVITMDIHMPGLDGFEVTRQIMETRPVPIVIVTSSFESENVAKSFRAMEAGALAIVEKPSGPTAPNFQPLAQRLVQTVKAMAGVRVIKRRSRARTGAQTSSPLPAPLVDSSRAAAPIELVAIGASTGGPPVLQTILTGLPKPFPAPVLIVQHISAGFVEGMAEWLTKTTGMPVCIAHDQERVMPGVAYLAPDGCHLVVAPGRHIRCQYGEPESGLRPAASCLFRSVATHYGNRAVGVLLTGMGRDRAAELKLMREQGAVTIAQDRETSVVHGMPGAAVELGAATHVLPPPDIAALLGQLVASRRPTPSPPP